VLLRGSDVSSERSGANRDYVSFGGLGDICVLECALEVTQHPMTERDPVFDLATYGTMRFQSDGRRLHLGEQRHTSFDAVFATRSQDADRMEHSSGAGFVDDREARKHRPKKRDYVVEAKHPKQGASAEQHSFPLFFGRKAGRAVEGCEARVEVAAEVRITRGDDDEKLWSEDVTRKDRLHTRCTLKNGARRRSGAFRSRSR
jgi:hypothetical protein